MREARRAPERADGALEAAAPSRSRARARRPPCRRAPRARRARAAARARSARRRAARSAPTAAGGASSGARRPGRRPPAPRPRTGSARAGCRRRWPPRARGRAARAAACTPCRRGSGRGSTGSGRCSRAPRSSSARRASSSRNGDGEPAPRQAALLQPEHEDGVEAARARAQQVEDRDAARLVAVHRAQRLPLERRDDVLALELAAERAPALELAEQPRHRLVRAQVEPGRLADRRAVEPVRVAQHARRELAHRLDRVAGAAQLASAGTGPSLRLSVSSTTRSGVWIARPRSRPSTKSTARRSSPENGERRKRRGRAACRRARRSAAARASA